MFNKRNLLILIPLAISFIISYLPAKQENKVDNFELTNRNVSLSLFDTIGGQLEFVTLEDTLNFNEYFINELRKEYPEIDESSEMLDPQEAYATCAKKVKSTERQKTLWSFFESQAGMDNFHLVYAIILREKNQNQDFSKIRENLLNVLHLKNRFNSILNFGGTYYGHKHTRIYADVEHEIYILIKEEFDIYNIPIEFNKERYISQLKDLVNRIAKEEDMNIKNPVKWKKEPFEIINKLDRLLTNYYYLKKCAELG